MKKILSLLTAITLTTSGTSSVIACGQSYNPAPSNIVKNDLSTWKDYQKNSIKSDFIEGLTWFMMFSTQQESIWKNWLYPQIVNDGFYKFINSSLSKISSLNIINNDWNHTIIDTKTNKEPIGSIGTYDKTTYTVKWIPINLILTINGKNQLKGEIIINISLK